MPKNVVQDVMPSKRSIKDVSLPSRRKENSAFEDIERNDMRDDNKVMSEEPAHSPPDYDFDYDISEPKRKKWGLWALMAVFGLALIFGLLSLFTKAQVTVVAKNQTIPLQASLNALKNQPAGQFGYQIVSVSKSAQKEVIAGAEKQSDVKATGTIVIYNSGVTVQNLLINTRFADPNGLIFRITKAASVPKATVQNKQTIPGSVTATVVADQSGDKYNIGLSDFTVPGLQGTPQFKNVYGRSKTPMAGGFSGMSKSVDGPTLTQATNDMQNLLKSDLASQITSVIPQNFILFPTSISYSFGSVSEQPNTTSGKATLSVTGTASAIIFDRALLSQKIISVMASSTILQGPAEVKNIASLKLTLLQPTTLTKDYVGAISFQLQGDAKIVWLFDQSALKSDLLGINKSDLKALLAAKYPTIQEAQAKIFPIWKSSFPSDPNKITITQVDSF